jgi:hypothetical protein
MFFHDGKRDSQFRVQDHNLWAPGGHGYQAAGRRVRRIAACRNDFLWPSAIQREAARRSSTRLPGYFQLRCR